MGDEEGGFWRRVFSARGRNSRSDFWKVTALVTLAYVSCGPLSLLAGSIGSFWIQIVLTLAGLALAVPAFVAGVLNQVKRLHDFGRSGWWLLPIVLIDLPVAILANGPAGSDLTLSGKLLQALYGIVLLIIFGALSGQRGPNRFGPPRNAETIAEQFA